MPEEEKNKSLAEMIAERKLERKRQEEIENSATKVDPAALAEQQDEVSDLVYTWETEEHPQLSHIANQIERMGFELKVISEETGYHIWSQGKWTITMHPEATCVQLHLKQNSGNTYSALTVSIEENTKEDIVTKIAEIYFTYGDDEIEKMIKKDKAAWNKRYAKKLGRW